MATGSELMWYSRIRHIGRWDKLKTSHLDDRGCAVTMLSLIQLEGEPSPDTESAVVLVDLTTLLSYYPRRR